MTSFRPVTACRPTGLIAFIFALVVAAGGCGSDPVDKSGGDASRALKLVLAHHDHGREDVQAWADAVERLSGGTIEVDVVVAWRARDRDFEAGTLEDVRGGKVAMATVDARAYDDAGVTSFQPLEAPLLVDSSKLATEIAGGDIGRTALAGTAELGITGLALLPVELRRPVGLSRALTGPRDFRGARVYTREGGVARKTLAALGAIPVRRPLGDWYEGVDAAELGLSGLKGEPRVARAAAGVTANVVLWPELLTVVINNDVFAGLSDAQKSALRKAGNDALDEQVELRTVTTTEARDILCRLGTALVYATPAELTALDDAVEPVYAAIERNPGNRAAIRAIRALKGNADPEELRCPAGVGPSAARSVASTRLAGTYESTVTEKQLANSKFLYDEGEINDENWGDFTITLTPTGHVRVTQRNARARSAMSGTYSVDGQTIEMDMKSIGETFAFRWSLYRDTLRFIRDEKLGVSPTPFLIQAFRRRG